MSRSDRVIGIVLGLVIGVVALILFLFLGSEGSIDAPSIDNGSTAITQPDAGGGQPSGGGSGQR